MCTLGSFLQTRLRKYHVNPPMRAENGPSAAFFTKRRGRGGIVDINWKVRRFGRCEGGGGWWHALINGCLARTVNRKAEGCDPFVV